MMIVSVTCSGLRCTKQNSRITWCGQTREVYFLIPSASEMSGCAWIHTPALLLPTGKISFRTIFCNTWRWELRNMVESSYDCKGLLSFSW